MTSEVEIERPDFAPYQLDFLYSPKRFTVVEASTKTGKTFSHIYWLFEIAHGGNPVFYTDHVKAGWEFWWVAPIYPQAEIAFNRLKRKVEGTGMYEINLSKLTIVTPLGTIIRFKSADKPDGLYGEDVYAVVFDEFTRAKETAWHAIRSTLTFTKGICKFIGNYTGSTNWGHKLGKKAKSPNSEYAYFKVDAYQAVEAGILSQQEVDQARKDLPKSVFDALYLAQGSAEGDILFYPDKITDLFTNTFVPESRDRYITADIATYGSDRFVVCVWHGMRVKEITVVEKCEANEVEALLKLKAEQWHVPRSNIVYDADGIGSFLRGYLKDARPFNNGAAPFPEKGGEKVNYLNLKAQCFYKFAQKVADSAIYIEVEDYREDVERELEIIRRQHADKDGKLRVTPKEEVKKILGYSPDMAEALMMRMYFEVNVLQKRYLSVS